MRKHSYPTPRTSPKTTRRAGRERLREPNNPFSANSNPQATTATPFYDSDRRKLHVGTIVKCFTQGSDAQEIILASFQEEDWCHSIYDPLPVKDDQDAKQRLRRAVNNLNRRQRVHLLHFQVIRQDTGVAWELLENSDVRATVERR